MRVVLDSNVLLSGLVSRGLCETVVVACLEHHDIVASEHILEEVAFHLTDKFHASPEQVTATVDLLRRECELVNPADVPASACRDPDDLKILGTALAGHVKWLVTGDRDLLALDQFQEIQILSPRAFCELLGKE